MAIIRSLRKTEKEFCLIQVGQFFNNGEIRKNFLEFFGDKGRIPTDTELNRLRNDPSNESLVLKAREAYLKELDTYKYAHAFNRMKVYEELIEKGKTVAVQEWIEGPYLIRTNEQTKCQEIITDRRGAPVCERVPVYQFFNAPATLQALKMSKEEADLAKPVEKNTGDIEIKLRAKTFMEIINEYLPFLPREIIDIAPIPTPQSSEEEPSEIG